MLPALDMGSPIHRTLRGGPCPSISSCLSVFVYLCLNFCVYILLYLSFKNFIGVKWHVT